LIQATLIFLLGFLSAGFIAVLVAPAIWRRAVVLTRRRVEAALPLSMAEIRADKDAMRAGYAVATRKLEMTIKSMREEMVEKSLEIERAREAARNAAQALEDRLAARERVVAEQAAELESLGTMYDEASFAASSRQIELVAQEANIERMGEEISALSAEREQAGAQLREASRQVKEQERALREEKRRILALERKAARLTTALSNTEEKLQRRERDLQRLRGKLQGGQPEADNAADMSLLRERIKELAAEVVSLTARVEGPGSEIHKLLGPGAGSNAAEGAASLADRIRALQKQATEEASG